MSDGLDDERFNLVKVLMLSIGSLVCMVLFYFYGVPEFRYEIYALVGLEAVLPVYVVSMMANLVVAHYRVTLAGVSKSIGVFVIGYIAWVFAWIVVTWSVVKIAIVLGVRWEGVYNSLPYLHAFAIRPEYYLLVGIMFILFALVRPRSEH